MNSYRIQSVILLIMVINCSFLIDSPANYSQEELRKDLEKRGYRIFTRQPNYDINKKVAAIELNIKGQYKPGDFEKICRLKNIKQVFFEGIDILEINKADEVACSKSEVNRFGFTRLKLKTKDFCQLVKQMNPPRLVLDFTKVNLEDQDIICFSEIPNLESFITEIGAVFSDESFCKFASNAKKLTFLRLNDSPLTQKSLRCMLKLPSLTEVMLQRWKNVSEEEMDEWVKEYEIKYNRKLEAQIIDPIGYER